MCTRSCILHIEGTRVNDNEVKQFDNASWKKVKEAEKSRRSKFHESKYFSIVLPDMYTERIGYHSECYKNFTAIPVSSHNEQIKGITPRTLRSDVSHPTASTSGVFPKACILCRHVTKSAGKGKKEHLGSCETEQAEESIRAAAQSIGDESIITLLSGIDLKAKEVKYHHSCKREYLNNASRARQGDEISTDQTTDKENVFHLLTQYIDENIVENGAEYMSALHRKYLLFAGATDEPNDVKISTKWLCMKILKYYPDKLRKCNESKKTGNIICSITLSEDTAIRKAKSQNSVIIEAALLLRRAIKEKINNVDNVPNAQDKYRRPKELMDFFRMLYTGTILETDSEKKERLVKSVSDDVIYAASGFKMKPEKHITMGVGMKSMTGSRKVVEVLNHFGHSISYHAVEEYENSIAYNITEKDLSTPDGIQTRPGLCVGLAWDNYDENNETLSGAGTLHDTVGICYQNEAITAQEIQQETDQDKQQAADQEKQRDQMKEPSKNPKKKRSFQVDTVELQPYRKKPKVQEFKYVIRVNREPGDLEKLENRDYIWMMTKSQNTSSSDHLEKPILPMWVGWNSLVTRDELPRQTIAYMNNLSLPPTRLDVVAETLRISQKVAKECREEYIVVHYDLAIAKPAMQIQSEEAPLYDNVFVAFGPFHTELAYFGVLGHYLEASGGPEILIEQGVLAPGSLSGFLLGKHYNRCKRLHPLLALALQILHFKKFTREANMPNVIHAFINDPTPNADSMEALESSEDYTTYMHQYRAFTQRTLEGEHGSTAQYWVQYIELVHRFQLYSRGYRTNNLDLFVYALGLMIPAFFAGNRPNYARWMIRYHLNLLNIDTSHPGLRQVLENGALAIKRTNRPFSRTAVDMTLEQSINADAASRLTGIAAFARSDGARQRWMITRSARSAIVGDLLTQAGLKAHDDVAKETKRYRLERDQNDLIKVLDGVASTMDPFDLELDDSLYCLTTGRAASKEIKEDLLNIQNKGSTWADEFMNGCTEDPKRFEKPIPRRKIKNFTSDAIKTKIPAKDQKLKELLGTRDLFGRLLYLSTLRHLDLEKVFEFPLTPVPHALAHLDGTMHKTDKAKLMHQLEKLADKPSDPTPEHIHVTLVDAMFLLHLHKNPPASFGAIARQLLKQLCSMSERVDFVCDRYITSIKDLERNRRGSSDASFKITGPEQTRPKDWEKALQLDSFKTAFLRFLLCEWQNDQYAELISGHVVYAAADDHCLKFTSERGQTICEEMPNYKVEHVEADTRIIYHLMQILEERDEETVIAVRASDTDILILLLYHVAVAQVQHKIYMDTGVDSTNTRRYINVSHMVDKIDKPVITALPGLHALTGCDYTSAFLNKGKVRPLTLMMESKYFTEAVATLGSGQPVETTKIEEFVCTLYGHGKLKYVNTARFESFLQHYAPKKKGEPLDRIKGINPSSMPPCQAVLDNKIKRADYVATLWKQANQAKPASEMAPEQCGWEKTPDGFKIKWFNCEQLPREMAAILQQESTEDVSIPVDEDEEVTYGEMMYGADEYDSE